MCSRVVLRFFFKVHGLEVCEFDVVEIVHRAGLHDVIKVPVLGLIVVEVEELLVKNVDVFELEAFGLMPGHELDRSLHVDDVIGVGNDVAECVTVLAEDAQALEEVLDAALGVGTSAAKAFDFLGGECLTNIDVGD